jgi:hypothetical protein
MSYYNNTRWVNWCKVSTSPALKISRVKAGRIACQCDGQPWHWVDSYHLLTPGGNRKMIKRSDDAKLPSCQCHGFTYAHCKPHLSNSQTTANSHVTQTGYQPHSLQVIAAMHYRRFALLSENAEALTCAQRQVSTLPTTLRDTLRISDWFFDEHSGRVYKGWEDEDGH